jgi:hypothetical protein
MPELPPPLPPGERTVGQLVAETIRLYGDHFWHALPLGLPIAVLDQLELGRSAEVRIALFLACAPLLALAFAYASALAGKAEPSGRTLAVATGIGTAVLLPVSLLFTWFVLIAAVYLAFVGLAVPVAVIEDLGPRAAIRRAVELGRVDYAHALGSIATLVLVFFLSRQVLVVLLHGQADETMRVAIFLADLVLAPLLLLGTAMLYVDQAARLDGRSPEPEPRKDAMPRTVARRRKAS